MSANQLDAVRIEPESAPDAAVILMHGLGADGHDFESLVAELRLPPSQSVRWIFPHAPVRPVSINGGYRMRAWYDIVAIDPGAPEDREGIRESAGAIGRLVEDERKLGIPASRIFLAGFSQGGAVALFTAVRSPERLAGVIAMSCYLPLPAALPAEKAPANAATPIFMAHGIADPIVPFAFGEMSRDILRSNGYEVQWHTYQMEHSVCEDEVADLRAWLTGLMSLWG